MPGMPISPIPELVAEIDAGGKLSGTIHATGRQGAEVLHRVAKHFGVANGGQHVFRCDDGGGEQAQFADGAHDAGHGQRTIRKGDCTVQVLPAPDQQADKAALVEMTSGLSDMVAQIRVTSDSIATASSACDRRPGSIR